MRYLVSAAVSVCMVILVMLAGECWIKSIEVPVSSPADLSEGPSAYLRRAEEAPTEPEPPRQPHILPRPAIPPIRPAPKEAPPEVVPLVPSPESSLCNPTIQLQPDGSATSCGSPVLWRWRPKVAA